MFGSGLRIALGPFNFLFRDPKWPRACRAMHHFADYYVDKALQWGQECMDLEQEELKDQR